MDGAVSLPLSVSYLARSVPALVPTGFWVGPGIGTKMSVSRRAHTDECSLTYPPPVSVSPSESQQPPPPQETCQG